MRIREIELLETRLRLRERFEISTGGWDERRVILLRMESEGGESWSECVAAEQPNYSYETPDTAWHILTDFALPAVVGMEFSDPPSVLKPLAWVRGHPMALAAVEMGAWGLAATEKGVSLASLLGGTRPTVPVGVSVGLKGTDEELLAEVEKRMKERSIRPLAVEGLQTTGWVVLDYGDVVAHMFTDESRSYYNLERLWGDGKVVDWHLKAKPAVSAAGKKTD